MSMKLSENRVEGVQSCVLPSLLSDRRRYQCSAAISELARCWKGGTLPAVPADRAVKNGSVKLHSERDDGPD
jgi:hypothetical protein